jgi:DNA repair protein RadD
VTARPSRPYQDRALLLLRQSIHSGRSRVVLQLPTGAGKTYLASKIMLGALGKNKRGIFVVPRLVLIDQTIRHFEREGIPRIGVIQGEHPRRDRTAPIQIASAQTLIRRKIPRADIVIVDECHLRWEKIELWMSDPAWSSVPFVGLSATPWARRMGLVWDDLLKPTSIHELIEDGYLCRFKVFSEPAPDMSKVHIRRGDFKEDELSEVASGPELTANVISTWLEKGEGRPTLCYAVDLRHARRLQARFLAAGVATGYIDFSTVRADREKIFRKFGSGEIRIIVNVATLDTGLDLDVRCIIDARPTESPIRFVQTIGRGLRTAPGKDCVLILDHAGNHVRLGLVTEIDFDELDTSTPAQWDRSEEDKDNPRAPKIGDIVEKPGELVELELTRAPRDAAEAFYAMLLHHARSRGYKPCWVLHKFNEKFGYWPNAAMQRIRPAQPDFNTRAWIMDQHLEYARRANG